MLGTYIHTDAYVSNNNVMDISGKGLLAINHGSHTTHIRYVCMYIHVKGSAVKTSRMSISHKSLEHILHTYERTYIHTYVSMCVHTYIM